MAFFALKFIYFLLMREVLCSKYFYHREGNGNYDVYYGPYAKWSYREIKSPKSYKTTFEDRGDRPGTCIISQFVCAEPYPYSQTAVFECDFDYQCPRSFKCCHEKCFKHKICQPATEETDTNEIPTPNPTPENIFTKESTVTTMEPTLSATYSSQTPLESSPTTTFVPHTSETKTRSSTPTTETYTTPTDSSSSEISSTKHAETTEIKLTMSTSEPTMKSSATLPPKTSTIDKETTLTTEEITIEVKDRKTTLTLITSSDDEDFTYSGDGEFKNGLTTEEITQHSNKPELPTTEIQKSTSTPLERSSTSTPKKYTTLKTKRPTQTKRTNTPTKFSTNPQSERTTLTVITSSDDEDFTYSGDGEFKNGLITEEITPHSNKPELPTTETKKSTSTPLERSSATTPKKYTTLKTKRPTRTKTTNTPTRLSTNPQTERTTLTVITSSDDEDFTYSGDGDAEASSENTAENVRSTSASTKSQLTSTLLTETSTKTNLKTTEAIASTTKHRKSSSSKPTTLASTVHIETILTEDDDFSFGNEETPLAPEDLKLPTSTKLSTSVERKTTSATSPLTIDDEDFSKGSGTTDDHIELTTSITSSSSTKEILTSSTKTSVTVTKEIVQKTSTDNVIISDDDDLLEGSGTANDDVTTKQSSTSSASTKRDDFVIDDEDFEGSGVTDENYNTKDPKLITSTPLSKVSSGQSATETSTSKITTIPAKPGLETTISNEVLTSIELTSQKNELRSSPSTSSSTTTKEIITSSISSTNDHRIVSTKRSDSFADDEDFEGSGVTDENYNTKDLKLITSTPVSVEISSGQSSPSIFSSKTTEEIITSSISSTNKMSTSPLSTDTNTELQSSKSKIDDTTQLPEFASQLTSREGAITTKATTTQKGPDSKDQIDDKTTKEDSTTSTSNRPTIYVPSNTVTKKVVTTERPIRISNDVTEKISTKIPVVTESMSTKPIVGDDEDYVDHSGDGADHSGDDIDHSGDNDISI